MIEKKQRKVGDANGKVEIIFTFNLLIKKLTEILCKSL